jgi:hypothetical protein
VVHGTRWAARGVAGGGAPSRANEGRRFGLRRARREPEAGLEVRCPVSWMPGPANSPWTASWPHSTWRMWAPTIRPLSGQVGVVGVAADRAASLAARAAVTAGRVKGRSLRATCSTTGGLACGRELSRPPSGCWPHGQVDMFRAQRSQPGPRLDRCLASAGCRLEVSQAVGLSRR